MEELELVVKSGRDKEHRMMKFYAAFKGVDLDASEEDPKDRFEDIKRRAEARLSGKSDSEIEQEGERLSLQDFGLEVEVSD